MGTYILLAACLQKFVAIELVFRALTLSPAPSFRPTWTSSSYSELKLPQEIEFYTNAYIQFTMVRVTAVSISNTESSSDGTRFFVVVVFFLFFFLTSYQLDG